LSVGEKEPLSLNWVVLSECGSERFKAVEDSLLGKGSMSVGKRTSLAVRQT
jgi:hypothetical protein